MTASVYLAARFDRRDQLRGYRAELNDMGIDVTSRWLDNHGMGERDDATNGVMIYTPADLARCALEDRADIADADVFVTITETPDVGYTSGGRHVEFGIALALEKPILIVGPVENVFHELAGPDIEAGVDQVESWDEAKAVFARVSAEKSR